MGKKSKVGKQRKDKFYHLAKETGYRSRASFKLIQLNRKFEFLQRSRVCIDLCAAPGGWLQVAQQNMPVSSVIIGVDLDPIRPLSNVVTFQDDITTASCRAKLRKELKTWKADIVLNDGAPNVGKSWIHDAYQQNVLTLHAVRIATEFLAKGGYFVTKVFRSKDYQALVWVLKKLFKKIFTTKPQASRHESAEIFIVCQHYIAPDKIDPKFLDPAYVFGEIDITEKAKLNLAQPEGKKPKAEGYPENDYTLYHTVPVMDFINSENHVELLGECNEIVIDDEEVLNHPLTTNEIKECCKDVKVLGRGDIKSLMTWRKKLRAMFDERKKQEGESAQADVEEVEDEEDEEIKLLKEADELTAEQAKEVKKKKKKVLKQRKKLRDRMNLQMVLKNDQPIVEEDLELFKLKKIKSKNQLKDVEEDEAPVLDPVQPLVVDESRNLKRYDKEELNEALEAEDDDGVASEYDGYSEDDNEELEFETEDEEQVEEEDDDDAGAVLDDRVENPRLVDAVYGSKKNRHEQLGKMWFESEVFQGSDDDDELLQLEVLADKKKRKVDGKQNGKLEVVKSKEDAEDSDDDDLDDNVTAEKGESTDSDSERDEAVSAPKQKRVKLDPEELALGSMLIRSQKARRDIVDDGYNRYAFNDDNLPSWFVEDEQKHSKKELPVTKEMVAEYKAQLKALNAQPIKKVAEAKARKKRRATRRLEQARKRAEGIMDKLDMTDAEKAQQVKALYKKVLKKNDDRGGVTYVVAKKGTGRRVRRPRGVKGRFKVVDPRMKKDMLKKKAAASKKKRK
uniref:Putative rRNA methyltransferase n=1 Tax=Ornithodoros turicata TaxID=34597 RepID=A0A2R5LKM9_9ACAR